MRELTNEFIANGKKYCKFNTEVEKVLFKAKINVLNGLPDKRLKADGRSLNSSVCHLA